jgi:hypothetical protein
MPLGKTSLPIPRFLGAQEKNNLYLMAALGVIVGVYVAVNWTSMPVLQRTVSLFFVGLVMHLWEVGAQPVDGRALSYWLRFNPR